MQSPAIPSRPPALDTRGLGRPVHLLPRTAERLREALQGSLCQPWNRRYRTRYEVQGLTLGPLAKPGTAGRGGRWLRANGPLGALLCQIDRALVLGLMARRLGLVETPTQDTSETASATEDRHLQALARQLCVQVVQLLAQVAGDADAPLPTLSVLQPGNPDELDADAWQLELVITEAGAPTAMPLRLALAASYLNPLLRHLAGPARSTKPPVQPLERRLTLKLQARLLERELPLGDVLALRPGALIPVRLSDATVMVDEEALLRAAVAEHQGKLCLTSFQDLE